MVKREEAHEEGFTVEKVVDKKIVNGRVHYFLKWKGYPDSDNTWEPESNLDCPELIAQFEEKCKASKKKEKLAEPEKDQEKKKTPEARKRIASQLNSSSPKELPPPSTKKVKKDESQSDNFDEKGFHRSRSPEKIIGASEENGELKFVMKWKGIPQSRVVLAKDANKRYPQVVIDFYEERLTWHNVDEKKK